MKLKDTFGSHKPIIAMVHFPPLPGSPLYDAKRGMNGIIESASTDIAALQKGGVDAVMFGNEGDRPYILKATPESLAAYAAAVLQIVCWCEENPKVTPIKGARAAAMLMNF